MKAEELRLNNLVFYENKVYEIHTLAYQFPTLNTTKFGIGVVGYNTIHPIPLTEEWLLKFGFKNTHGEWYNMTYDGDIWVSAGIQQKVIDLYESEDGEPIRIWHRFTVHQLQNLYFALTGEELKLCS